MNSEPLVLEQRLGIAPRVILGVFGLVPLLAPYELHRGLWPITVVTPFFAIIVFGALSVSAAFLYAAIAGPEEHWRIDQSGIRIAQRALAFQREYFIPRDAALSLYVVEDDGTDGAPIFSIAIDYAGREHKHRVGESEARARALLQSVIERLG